MLTFSLVSVTSGIISDNNFPWWNCTSLRYCFTFLANCYLIHSVREDESVILAILLAVPIINCHHNILTLTQYFC